MNPLEARLQEVVPAGFTLQKCKCKDTKKALSIDLVVTNPSLLPVKNVRLLNLKGVSSVEDMVNAGLHVEGLILHKKLEITADALKQIIKAWGVKSLFDFRNKDFKCVAGALKKNCQAGVSDVLNKVVVNPNPKAKLACKAKVTFPPAQLPEVMALNEKKADIVKGVTSWKIGADLRSSPKEIFEAALACVQRFPGKVTHKKAKFTEDQKAAIAQAKSQ